MPHNPIKQLQLSRTDQPEIPINSQGVLYIQNRRRRLLDPGDKISLQEKIQGGLMLYIVDRAPHTASWRMSLPTRHESDVFPITINLTYWVSDSERMIKDQVGDTETLASRALEPILRKKSRDYRLNEYRQAEEALEAAITNAVLAEHGLSLLNVDVVMNLSDRDIERIKNLNDLDLAQRVPQQIEHQEKLPTKEAVYEFRARVIVGFRVTDPDLLPKATLEEAEQWLWNEVKPTLRPISRKYSVQQINEAEQEMQEALKAQPFSHHGLTIVSAQVEIDLDERAREHAVKLYERAQAHASELEKIRDEAALADEQARAAEKQAHVDKILHQSELDKERRAIDFYARYVEGGEKKLLAAIMSGKEEAEEVLKYLKQQQIDADAKEREQLALQAKLLEELIQKNSLGPKDREKMAQALSHTIFSHITSSSTDILGKPEEQKALDKGETQTTKSTEKGSSEPVQSEGESASDRPGETATEYKQDETKQP